MTKPPTAITKAAIKIAEAMETSQAKNTINMAKAAAYPTAGNLFANISKTLDNNLTIEVAANNHNVTYQNVYNLLRQAIEKGSDYLPMSEQITYHLIMTYLHTHLFNVTSHRTKVGTVTVPTFSSCNSLGVEDISEHVRKIYEYSMSESLIENEDEIKNKFNHGFSLHVLRQLETNYKQMQQDAVLRIQYVLGSFYTLNQVEQQQQTSVDLLTQLSDYVNEQVTEYSSVYERLHTLIDTQNRKITFQTSDVHTLERWQFWCRVAFWGLVVFFVLMVIVDSTMDISRFTSDMDDRLKRAASAASQATQALVGPSPGAGAGSV